MAKKLIQNYVFNPGVGLNDNLLPNAYSLIQQNKVFIQKEIRGFIDNQVADSVKCERDLGYIFDAAGFDITLGTNYNAVFQGTAEYNSAEISKTVVRTIQHEVLAPWLVNNVQDIERKLKPHIIRSAYEVTTVSTLYEWIDWLIYIAGSM